VRVEHISSVAHLPLAKTWAQHRIIASIFAQAFPASATRKIKLKVILNVALDLSTTSGRSNTKAESRNFV
jgi:hypothetical protein